MNINTLINFATEVRSEGRKVSWSTMKDALMSSFLVFVVVLFSASLFLIIDGAIYKFISYVLKLGVGK